MTDDTSVQQSQLKAKLKDLMSDRRKKEDVLKEAITFLQATPCGLEGRLIDSEGFPRDDCGDLYEIRKARNTVACTRNDLKMVMSEIETSLHQYHALMRDSVTTLAEEEQKRDSNSQEEQRGHPQVNSSTRTAAAAAAGAGGGGSRSNNNTNTVPFLLVERVEVDSPAARCGLQVGDRIVNFNGVVECDLQRILRTTSDHEGIEIPVSVLRRGGRKEEEQRRRETSNYQPSAAHTTNDAGGLVAVEIELMLVPCRWAGRGLLGCVLVPLQPSPQGA